MPDWNPHANELFASLLELPPDQRQPELARVCGADEELRRQVEALLAAHVDAGSFLDRPFSPGEVLTTAPDSGPPLAAAGSVVRALANNLPGVQLREPVEEAPGPLVRPCSKQIPAQPSSAPRLRLDGEIARGGMGAILKGHDGHLGRDVAVKVLLETHAGKTELVHRFVEEAQIAGQLQHPNIVPVYDLGNFDDHRPYFTMKLVKGQTLGRLLQERSSADEDRPRFLKVFEQVCHALAYAHARGVIHRDLKPSNVMVGSFGEVQVMDWGLAKVLPRGGVADESVPSLEHQESASIIQTSRSGSSAEGGTSSHTQAGSVLGTPAYMAPEQARGEVELIDERADVFGLGAMLCEILTGQPPFPGKLAEAHRKAQIADLADAFTRLDACAADADLIHLTKHCLAAEPWQRPRHAGEVATTMTTYLESVQSRLRRAEVEGAEARTRAEEQRKYFRATLAWSAASLLLLLFLLLAGVTRLYREREWAQRMLAQNLRIDQVLTDAHRARDHALATPQDTDLWEEALRAVEIAEGLLLHDHASSLRQRIEDLKTQILKGLDEARSDPRMLARLDALRLARSQVKGGQFDIASADPAYAEAFRAYGIDLDQLDPAEAAARIRTRSIRTELAVALDDWAWVRRNPQWPDDRLSQRLLTIAREVDPDPWRNRLRDALTRGDRQALQDLAANADVATQPVITLTNLGNVLLEIGDAEEAVALLRRIWRKHPGDFWVNEDLALALTHLQPTPHEEVLRHHSLAVAANPQSSGAWLNLGNELSQQFVRAQAAIRKPNPGGFRWVGELDILHELDPVLENLRLSDVALAALEKAISLQPDYADAHTALGDALQQRWQGQGQYAGIWESLKASRYQALFDPKLLDRALAAYEKSLLLRPNDGYTHFQRGMVLYYKDALDQALAAFRQAVRHQPDFIEAHDNLIKVLQEKQGDSLRFSLEKTLAACQEAIQKRPTDPDAHFYLGVAYLQAEKPREAEQSLRTSLNLKTDPVTRQYLGWALSLQARELTDQGKLAEAIAIWREVVKLQPNWDRAWIELGRSLLKTKQHQEGLAALQEGVKLSGQTDGSPGERLTITYQVLYEDYGSHLLRAIQEIARLQPHLRVRFASLRPILSRRFRATVASLRARAPQLGANTAEVLSFLSENWLDLKEFSRALEMCRELIRLRPTDPAGYFLLGRIHARMGRFDESLQALRRGHVLLAHHAPLLSALRTMGTIGAGPCPLVTLVPLLPNSHTTPEQFSSTIWIKDAQRLAQQEARLSAILTEKERPRDASERIELARMCATKQMHRTALRFYTEAFAERPDLAEQSSPQHRYNAACAAALAGCGQGKDALLFDCPQRAAWRKQALAWLRQDLAGYVARVVRERLAVRRILRHWQVDADLDGVRGPEAIARLPASERDSWTKFWAEIESLLLQVE